MMRAVFLFAICMATVAPVAAQDPAAARVDYFGAVAAFFNLPPNEIAILGDWELPADEIPVVLFMARRAGVSPEALVALRDSGYGWSALAERYRVLASALHVPIRDDAATGRLESAYALFRSTPVADWSTIRLTDDAIIALVNVRVISQSLRLPAERVIAEMSSASSFVDLYARLRR